MTKKIQSGLDMPKMHTHYKGEMKTKWKRFQITKEKNKIQGTVKITKKRCQNTTKGGKKLEM